MPTWCWSHCSRSTARTWRWRASSCSRSSAACPELTTRLGVAARLQRQRLVGERVGLLVAAIAVVAAHPAHGHAARVGDAVEALPQCQVGDRLALRIAIALALPAGAPFGQALEHVLTVGDELDRFTGRHQRQPLDGGGELGDLVGAEA